MFICNVIPGLHNSNRIIIDLKEPMNDIAIDKYKYRIAICLWLVDVNMINTKHIPRVHNIIPNEPPSTRYITNSMNKLM